MCGVHFRPNLLLWRVLVMWWLPLPSWELELGWALRQVVLLLLMLQWQCVYVEGTESITK
jgi:hypothetical protein